MTGDQGNGLKRRTRRELSRISFNEKLKYIALAALGLPFMTLIHIVLVVWVIDIFNASSGVGVLTLTGFVLVTGMAILAADFWILRWLVEEFNIFRWAGSDLDHGNKGDK